MATWNPFVGFKAVGESIKRCHRLWRPGDCVPITKQFPRSHTNPYGHSKLVCEDMLSALCASNSA